jgi:uncharacterized repeat protein (TIGR03803 family)
MCITAERVFFGTRMRRRAAVALSEVVLFVVLASAMQAQNFTLVYPFQGSPDGDFPTAGLIQDVAGNFYGTTNEGGTFGDGTVFKLDSAGKETVLHNFTVGSGDGSRPYGGLVRDGKGNLYGTTSEGGASNAGTVFKVDKTGNETVLYSFKGAPDGSKPLASLVRDTAGNLYGTTQYGGTSNSGTIFKLDNILHETILHSFAGGADGSQPYAGLIRDANGNFYGTTSGGGAHGFGTVFKLNSTNKATILHSFAGPPTDGEFSTAPLIRDSAGNLYGTTSAGGSGYGTVFKVDKTNKETVLHSFTGLADGNQPLAGLVRDAAGNLYGTTNRGGNNTDQGVVFKLDSTGTESVLHAFSGGMTDGAYPYAPVLLNSAGRLYGTTTQGADVQYGCCKGSVFQVTP